MNNYAFRARENCSFRLLSRSVLQEARNADIGCCCSGDTHLGPQALAETALSLLSSPESRRRRQPLRLLNKDNVSTRGA